MMFDRNWSVGLVPALTLALALGCASKKADDSGAGAATGGNGYCFQGCGTDAGSTGGGGATLDPNYCNGLLSKQICSQTNLQADVREVDMLLVIDQSGSMNDPPSATSTSTKWSDMTQALSGTLPSFQNDISFGLLLYPYNEGGLDRTSAMGSCTLNVGASSTEVNVGITPGTPNLDSMATDILPTVRNSVPAGGTPTAKALTRAYAYFTQGAGKDLTGKKYVLLATDGGPNCNSAISCQKETCTQNLDGKCGDPSYNCCDTSTPQFASANLNCLDESAVVKQIEQLKLAGIVTYVIGIPGSEAYATTLDKMSDAGGAPNTASTNGHTYYEVSAAHSLADLQAAFSQIITQLVKTCDIELKNTPSNQSNVQAVKDCEIIPPLPNNQPPAPDAGKQDGFYIDYSLSPAHLVLTGSYCESIMTLGAQRLDIIEGCYSPQ